MSKNQYFTDSIADTPSIFFVIDNSGSMGFHNTDSTGNIPWPLNDSLGFRFKATTAFIDSIYKKYPTAKIGVAVFDSALAFDPTRDTIIKTPPAPNNQRYGYLPLLNLDKTYYRGLKGIDILHEYLRDSLITIPAGITHNGTMTQMVDLVHNARRFIQYTNINVGFAAAKNALPANATAREKATSS